MLTFHILIAGWYVEVRRDREAIGHLLRIEDYSTSATFALLNCA